MCRRWAQVSHADVSAQDLRHFRAGGVGFYALAIRSAMRNSPRPLSQWTMEIVPDK